MGLAVLLAVQAAAAAPAPMPIDFDLARLRAADPFGESRVCDRTAADAIVVCGRRVPRGAAYPMAEMARRYERGPLVAETGLGGSVTGRAFVEAVELDRGAVSNRFMIGIRIPF